MFIPDHILYYHYNKKFKKTKTQFRNLVTLKKCVEDTIRNGDTTIQENKRIKKMCTYNYHVGYDINGHKLFSVCVIMDQKQKIITSFPTFWR